MNITILGSGTLLSDVSRKPCAFLLQQGREKALLDVGPAILYQLKSLRIDVLELNTVFFTHFHPDHCADLIPFLLNRYLLHKEANRHLKIYGPVGLQSWFATMAGLQGSWLQQALPGLVELDKNKVNWSDCEVRTWPTHHTAESIAYRFDGEKTYFFSGDTGYEPDLIEFARGVDVAFLECSHRDEHKMDGHLTASEAGQFADRAQVGRLIVNHLYPENDTDDLPRRIGRFYKGPVSVAADLMQIDET